MEIQIESLYDGWTVIVDGERFSWNQEDDHEVLEHLLHRVNPNADITFEECY